MIYIIGMGPGNIDYMTSISIEKLKKAEILIGGRRHIDMISIRFFEMDNKEKFYITTDLENMKNYILENKEKNIAVLASGDPSLYGIGDYIYRNLKDRVDIEVIPGISSVQYCFSRFNLNMNDVYITSSHGRELDYDFLFMHDKISMVTDKKVGPYEISNEIEKRGLDYDVYVGENLSYENEILSFGSHKKFLEKRDYCMCVIILIKSRNLST